jgi:molecular chaperone DnaK (HSP70)
MNAMMVAVSCVAVALLLSLTPASCGPVVGIDMGSMWYKVAMIQGQQMDLVLDVAGDRKRNTWVGIKGEDRVFGRDAEAMVRGRPR